MAYRYGDSKTDARVIEKMTWKVALRFVDLSELARQMYCKFCRAILDLNRIADEKQIGFACEWTIDCHCGKRNLVYSVTPAEEIRDLGQREHAFSVNIKAAFSIKKHSIPMHVLCNFFQDLGMPFGLEHDHQQCLLTKPGSQIPKPSSSAVFDSGHTGSQFPHAAGGSLLQAAHSDQEPLPSPDIKVEVDDDGLTEPMTSTSFPRVVLDSSPPRRATRGRKKKTASLKDSSLSSEVWIPCDLCGAYLASESNLKSHQLSVHAGISAAAQNVALPQGIKRKRGRPKGSKGKKNWVVSTKVMPRATRLSQKEVSKSKPTSKVRKQESDNAEVTPASEACHLPTVTKSDDNLPVTFAASVLIKKDFRRYTCRMCGKEFANLWSQKKHERSHSDELPYGCGQCSLKFRATHQLIHHIKVNHGTAFGVSKPLPNAAQTSNIEKAATTPGKPSPLAKAEGGSNQGTADDSETETESGIEVKVLVGKLPTSSEAGTSRESDLGNQATGPEGTGEAGTSRECDLGNQATGSEGTAEAGTSRECDFGGHVTGSEGTGGEPASVSARPQCNICLAYFPTTKSLFNHRRMHKEGTDLYKCTRCDRTFRFRKDLIGHLKSAHNEEFHYICPTCGKAFRNYGSLYNHKFSHDKVKKFQCGTCGRLFSRRGTLLRHELCHRQQHAYRCGICNKGYNLCQHLRQHMTSHKEHRSFKKEGPFICHKCGKIYSCSSSLHVHLMTHRMADLSVETLDSFLNISEEVIVPAGSSLEREETEREEPGEPKHMSTPHKVYLCGNTYKTVSSLHRHTRLAHGLGDGPKYICSKCGKGFEAKDYLESHTNMHKKIAPHKCATCGKVFKSKVCMMRHMKDCGAAERSSFPCTECDKIFSCKKYLTQHRNSHSDLARYRCLTCLKRFKHQPSLHRHSKLCRSTFP